MKKTAALLLSSFLFTALLAQTTIKDFVQRTAVAIPAIHPDSTDYADLEAIGNAIGDGRVVMLGEQDHGDAPTYLAKTRIVKYLHEKKGFNVLAIESDFFALNSGWEFLPKDSAAIIAFLNRNIFPIWTACDACFPLFRQYIPATFKTASPLQISGFDSQMSMDYSVHLTRQLDSVLRSWQLPVTTIPEYSNVIIPMIDSLRFWWYRKPSDTLFDQCAGWLQRIKQEATQTASKDNFWMVLIDNLLQENEEYRHLKLKNNRSLAGNVRDMQMAANLAWLTKVKYRNEKIIVWAASQHIAKLLPGMPGNRLKVSYMGGIFTTDPALAATTYVLGFSSYEGTAGRLGMRNYTLPKPKKESFENWVRPKGAYAFVDFKSYQPLHPGKREWFHMSGYNHFNVEADWTSIFDGVFYIDKMYTCKKTEETAGR